MYQYEATIINLINDAMRTVKSLPLILGGVTDSGGGTGGPPGGFVGVLPQTKVAYDTSELSDDTTPVSGASILDNLNHIRSRVTSLELLEASPATDHEISGTKTTLTAGTALTFGKVCYMGSDGKMEKTDADAIATCGGWALCLEETLAEDGSGEFLLHGFARDDSWNWSSVGSFVYADTITAGGMVQVPASGADDVYQILGIATATNKIYFNPQLVQVEHV